MTEFVECARCTSTVDRENTWTTKGSPLLCGFCSGTHLGIIQKYPNQYSEETLRLAKGITQSFNIILNKIEDLLER